MDLKILFLSTILHFGSCKPVAGFPLQYDVGKTYVYSYSTQTALNVLQPSPKSGRGVGFKFSATVELNPVWAGSDELLVRLQINSPKLHSVARPDVAKDLKGLPRQPVYFHWKGGKVREVLASQEDSTLAINIKKGVISLLQLRIEEGTHTEVDSSGECTVSYTKSGSTITRTKTGCESVETTGQYSTVTPLMSVTKNSHIQTMYTIQEDLIHSAVTSEQHTVSMNLEQSVATTISMEQSFKLQRSGKGSTVKASSIKAAIESIKKKKVPTATLR